LQVETGETEESVHEAKASILPRCYRRAAGGFDLPTKVFGSNLIASPAGNSVPLNQFTKQEDLGTPIH
jgi:hypothetical protein